MPVDPMTLQNRVTPFGEIVADPARGTMMGNRGGCFHNSARQLARHRWASKCWITCLLRFKSRQRTVMTPKRYTELFFLDEATALAAGHRPCAECRRADFNRYATLWNKIRDHPGRAYVREMDQVLHRERGASAPDTTPVAVRPGDQPDGAFVSIDGAAHLVWRNRTWRWTMKGYEAASRPGEPGPVTLITPLATRDILAAGYQPQIHESLIAF